MSVATVALADVNATASMPVRRSTSAGPSVWPPKGPRPSSPRTVRATFMCASTTSTDAPFRSATDPGSTFLLRVSISRSARL